MRFIKIAAAIVAVGAAMLGAQPSNAGKADDTLHIVWKESVPNIDPYFNQLRSGYIIASLAMDTLILKNPDTGKFQPLLATSWEWIDNTTLRFKLRDGVKFHNGEIFDADDVVYTLNFIADSSNHILLPNLGFIKGAKKVDALTVDVELKNPFPAALEYFASIIAIYPNEYHSKVGPEGMGKHLVGTGPYIVKEIDGISRYLLVRNENYFDGGAKGKPAIGKIEIRVVNDESTELLEFMSGKADWIWKFNADQVPLLQAQPNITANLYESMRTGFLNLNIIGDGTSKDNPLANVKVRQAIAHAINKEELVKYLVQGEPLRPALEVWAHVLSRPERDRIIVGLGKRDASYDAGLPIPLGWSRPGTNARYRTIPPGHEAFEINDQHLFVRVPVDTPLKVGDMVGFGISHPCLTFDKWRIIPTVDDDYTIVSAISTAF